MTISREDLSLFVMGEYDGDVAALGDALALDENARVMLVEEAELELALRDAAAAATFCPNCDDLIVEATVSGVSPRCSSCGTATTPGGYTVERVLVANAHGRMYVARDADGTQVALKELAFVQAPSADTIAAFEREARFLRALSHSAIPRYRAAFQEGHGVHTRYYLAQELVDGAALDTRLDEHFYTEAEIVDVARHVLEVLVYLQSLSPMVIHRDIKPANLLRRTDGSIALVDFGAAHVQGTTAGSTSIGTFGYMPMEQLAGIVDATTDVYALGASLVHLMTRREPWRILALPTLGASNVSPSLGAFLAKLVAPEPADRFPSAAAALATLDRVGKEPMVITGAAALRLRDQRRKKVTTAMAGIAILAALGGLSFVGVKALTGERPMGSVVGVQRPTQVASSPVPAGDIISSGYIAARGPIVLAARPGGLLAELKVEIGSNVQKGEIIAVLGDGPLRAELALAESRLRAAQRVLEQTQTSFKASAVTTSEVNRALADVEIAQGELRLRKENLEETKIRSPIDGVVLEVLARPGEALAAGAGVVRLADLSMLVAETDISEAELRRIEVGQRAEVVSEAQRDRPYKGVVSEIAQQADRARGTVLVRIVLERSTDSKLKPGMAVQVRFGRGTPTRAGDGDQTSRPSLPERYAETRPVELKKPGASLDHVLVDLAKECRLNVVLPDYVRGTGATTGPVPCGEIFNALMESNGLDYHFDKTLSLAVVGDRDSIQKANIARAQREKVRTELKRTDHQLPTGGPSISLDLDHVKVGDVLKVIADAGKVQLVIPDYAVRAVVSLRLDNVPWQAAMIAVLEASGLGLRYRDQSRIVRIAGQEELDKDDARLLSGTGASE